MGLGVVGLAENKANSAPLELELRLSLAILHFCNIYLKEFMDSVPDPNKHKNRAEVVEIYENICNQIVFILLMTGQYCAYIMLYIEQN